MVKEGIYFLIGAGSLYYSFFAVRNWFHPKKLAYLQHCKNDMLNLSEDPKNKVKKALAISCWHDFRASNAGMVPQKRPPFKLPEYNSSN